MSDNSAVKEWGGPAVTDPSLHRWRTSLIVDAAVDLAGHRVPLVTGVIVPQGGPQVGTRIDHETTLILPHRPAAQLIVNGRESVLAKLQGSW